MAEYELKVDDDGEVFVNLGKYTVCRLYYSTDRVKSPLSQERAKALGEALILILNEEYPADEFEGYDKGKFEEILETDEGEELLKMFLMGKLLGAI